jgi:hypothetical protein
MQLDTHTAPMVVLVETEEMGEMPVVAVMVHLAEQYDWVLPEMTHIS